jgi:hypothetical protein
MALDKLKVYNNALILVGERTLTSLTENREPRRLLDSSFDFDAINYCLEIVKPVFSRKTIKLTNSVPSVNHDLDNVFTLPSDWIATVDVYSDSRLDQPITRYINEDRTIACEYDTVFVRYTSSDNAEVYTKWSPAFALVVSTYLAREISTRLVPAEYETLNEKFSERIEAALNIESTKEPRQRSKASTSTLSLKLLNIYNDALQLMGLEKITDNNDDSHRRSVLDTSIDADLVEATLEDIGWHWALKSILSNFDPALEPEWGWDRGHKLPDDLHRLEGVFHDEFFQRPLKTYLDEDGILFTDFDVIYIQYVSSSFLIGPDNWSPSFRRLIAARMAKDAYMVLAPESANRVEAEFEKRESAAKSIDAMQSPPRLIAEGSWVRARNTGRSQRRRP